MLGFASGAFAQQLVSNGGFESGLTNWQSTITGGNFYANAGFSFPHSGSRYLYLSLPDGTPGNNLIGSCYQSIAIPANATSADLTFWVNVTTQETGFRVSDAMILRIENSSGSFLLDGGGWSNLHGGVAGQYFQPASVSLTQFAGQTVRVHFFATTNAQRPTTFRVDDVRLDVVTNNPPTANWTTPPPPAVSAGSQFTVAFSTSGTVNQKSIRWHPTDPTTVSCCSGSSNTTSSSTVSPTASPVTLTAPTRHANGALIVSPTTVKFAVRVVGPGGTGFSSVVSVVVAPPGSACSSLTVADCNGYCSPIELIGDGFCDDGTFGINGVPIYLNCPSFNNDGGDCFTPLSMVTSPPGPSALSQLTYEPLPNIAPNVDNLVILVHGRNTTNQYITDFWQPFANDIASHILAPGTWAVRLWKWPLSSFAGVNQVVNNAEIQGEALGDEINEIISRQQIHHIHLIAHSAGARAIATATERIREVHATLPTIHCTFLDAYAGTGGFGAGDYGRDTNWSDHYFSEEWPYDTFGACGSNDFWQSGFWTELRLSKAYNVNVTRLDPDYSVTCKSDHSWPYCFYQHSIANQAPTCCSGSRCPPSSEYMPLGFSSSKEVLGESWLPNVLLNYHPGGYKSLPPEGLAGAEQWRDLDEWQRRNQRLHIASIGYGSSSATDVVVTADGFGASLTSDGPQSESVWMNLQITFSEAVNFIELVTLFQSGAGAQGMLTLFVDGQQYAQIDERHARTDGTYSFNLPDSVVPGVHALSLRLDRFSPVASVVVVRDIVTGFGKLVPRGDITGDGVINVSDLLAVISSWGTCPPAPLTCAADVAGNDGAVNVSDLLLVISAWGSTFVDTGAWFAGIGSLDYAGLPAVSADGSSVVGYYSMESGGGGEAYRWRRSMGRETLHGLHSASGVSANGSRVLGGGLWTSDGILPIPNAVTERIALSDDGNWVAGSLFVSGGREACLWSVQTGVITLGFLDVEDSLALDVNADGTVVVGVSNHETGYEAFRWTVESGMVSLGTWPGFVPFDYAHGVSADGTVIVGEAVTPSGSTRAFRWTAQTGKVELSTVGQACYMSRALAVSSDGNTIVGDGCCFNGSVCGAMIWTPSTGVMLVRDRLESAGIVDLEGWDLVTASDIAADGRTIVGYGTNPNGQNEHWVAHLP